MARATWNGTIIAESDDTIVVEGNHYFPPDAVRTDHLRVSAHSSVCSWKGTAAYYDVVAGGDVNENAAWYYPAPLDAATHIAGYVAFWKGVTVEA